MYNPNDPRQQNWHRQGGPGRGGGFEQEPRYNNPAPDQRDEGMYGRDDRRDSRHPSDPRQPHPDYRGASDSGQDVHFGGRESYGAHSRPPQEPDFGAEGPRQGDWHGEQDEVRQAPRNYGSEDQRGRPDRSSNNYQAFSGDYQRRPDPAHQNLQGPGGRRDVDDRPPRTADDAPTGQSNFVRQDRGTWGALGPRGNFGPETSNPGQPPGGPRGTFAGRGPKGYRRGDDRIMEDVCQVLTDDPDVDAADIEVKVQEGEVILAGTVDSRRTKRHAEDLVCNLPGVREVHNQLRIKQHP